MDLLMFRSFDYSYLIKVFQPFVPVYEDVNMKMLTKFTQSCRLMT